MRWPLYLSSSSFDDFSARRRVVATSTKLTSLKACSVSRALPSRVRQSPATRFSFPAARSMSNEVPTRQRALIIQKQGGIEELEVRDDVEVPQPSQGEVLIRTEWSGVNFIDTYQRSGVYKIETPKVLGSEVAGKVVKLGPGAEKHLKVGDRVMAYTQGLLGGFAQYTKNDVAKTVVLPGDLSSRDAASYCLQGLTACTFVEDAHKVEAGQFVFIPAAAGGLGSLLTQICAHRKAKVIAAVSNQDKAKIAKANGASHVLLYGDGNLSFDKMAEEVLKLTDGEGVHVCFDGVGKTTFQMDLKLLRRKGSLVSCGNASGAVEPIAPLALAAKNLKLSRPVLGNYVATRDEFEHYSKVLFDLIKQGVVRHESKTYDFTTEGLRAAQTDISSRGTTGKLLVQIQDV